MKFKVIEKHDIKNVILINHVEEFTKLELVRIFNKKNNNTYHYCTYYIEDILQELVSEGYLVASYSSVKVESDYYTKTGSKTVATYRVKKD